MAQPIKILFVCMGNLCRSPMAEGVFKHQVKQAHRVRVGPAQSIDSVM